LWTIVPAAVVVLLAVPSLAVPLDQAPGLRPVAMGPILASCYTGVFASQPVYDPVTHDLYVLNQGSGNISVVAPSCTVIATISLPTGADPIAGAFNPATNRVFVVDATLNCVYIIGGTKLVLTLGHGHFNAPTAIAWDPGDNAMFVANFGWSNITSIIGSVVGPAITVGVQPSSIAYDPYYNSILVAAYGSNNVTILTSATYPFSNPETTICCLGDPESVVYDPADHDDYIANYATGSVTIVDGLGTVITTVGVGSNPISETFDQAKLAVYVANEGSGNVTILQGTSAIGHDLIGRSTSPIGIVYDDDTDTVYVAGTATGTLYEIS
jgi:DNA-binding beta-propeller fold protein YncE